MAGLKDERTENVDRVNRQSASSHSAEIGKTDHAHAECEDNDEGANAEVQTNPAPSVHSITISPQRRTRTVWPHGAHKWRSGIKFGHAKRQGTEHSINVSNSIGAGRNKATAV